MGCRLDLKGMGRRRYLSSGALESKIVEGMEKGKIGFECGRVDMEVGKRMARKGKERYRCPYYC